MGVESTTGSGGSVAVAVGSGVAVGTIAVRVCWTDISTQSCVAIAAISGVGSESGPSEHAVNNKYNAIQTNFFIYIPISPQLEPSSKKYLPKGNFNAGLLK
jgi:hypothetical protein